VVGAAPESSAGLVQGEAPAPETGFATYYARRFAGRKTSNGDRYDPSLLTAAHRTLPFGTMVEVRRVDGRRVVVRINDRGPYGDAGRVIDLSRRAAEELGIVQEGKVRVELRPIAPAP
jgi:rare lipoprotein A